MTRIVTIPAIAVVVCVSLIAPASAQVVDQPPLLLSNSSADLAGEIHGIVTDERSQALSGVVVSALGPMTAFAMTDRTGRFGFPALAPGSYLLRAHLQGYTATRASSIKVRRAAQAQAILTLTHGGVPQVLAAGLGSAVPLEGPADEAAGGHDHSDLAWRLRRLTRSVLKDARIVFDVRDEASLFVDSLESVGRAMGAPARLASALLTELPLTGHVNLLTSLDRPQDLLSWAQGAPHGLAYLSLVAPTFSGDWTMRGALTDGDLSSWMLAGSYRRRSPSTHAYEAGWSYAMQQYLGGNSAALAAASDSHRNAGDVYAYDHWRVAPAVTVSYGARYSRYGYLDDQAFVAPKATVSVAAPRGLSLRATAARSVLAPGAQELHPASEIGVWVPPERTFSPVRRGDAFRAERVDHYEVSAEQEIGDGIAAGIRAFRQEAGDQLVALFGVSFPRSASTEVGHYHVASAGNMRAAGWSVGLSRGGTDRIRGSVNYTQATAVWKSVSPDAALLALVAPSIVRAPRERLHDLTASLDTEVPVIATRVLVVYSAKSSASPGTNRAWRPGMRYDVEVRQALPSLSFTKAEWAMLLAVRNRFHEALMDASVYDELLVLRPPKRIVGGLTVQF